MTDNLEKRRRIAYSKNASVQRDAIEEEIKRMNEAMLNDDLWKGRFVIELCEEGQMFEQYADGSGAVLTVLVNVYDLKRKKYKQFIMDTQEILLFDYLYFALIKAFPCAGSRKFKPTNPAKTDYRNADIKSIMAESVKCNKIPERVR